MPLARPCTGGLGWKSSRGARQSFILRLGVATLVGLALNFVHFDPIRSLFVAAVINGLLAAPVMALMMLMTGSRKIMGEFTLPALSTGRRVDRNDRHVRSVAGFLDYQPEIETAAGLCGRNGGFF